MNKDSPINVNIWIVRNDSRLLDISDLLTQTQIQIQLQDQIQTQMQHQNVLEEKSVFLSTVKQRAKISIGDTESHKRGKKDNISSQIIEVLGYKEMTNPDIRRAVNSLRQKRGYTTLKKREVNTTLNSMLKQEKLKVKQKDDYKYWSLK